jgi:hypothetical protein
MPGVQSQVHGGVRPAGGIVSYPLEQLHEEVAYIAYHFHWPLDQILSMEHRDRRLWAEKIADINRKLTEVG